jgi:hypothetical protein
VRNRHAATAALLLLALALLAGCGSGTATVIFKDKTDESQTGSTAEGESAEEGGTSTETTETGEPLPEVAI